MCLIELNDEREIRNSWIQKRNALRKTEVTISDANQLHSVRTEIEKIDSIISEIETKISSLEAKIKGAQNLNKIIQENLSNEETDDNDILKALEVLRQETKDLNCKSTKEDVAKIHNLKIKLFGEIFKDTDDQLNFITEKKELMYSSVLFEQIYSNETLDPITILEIQKIREDNENYYWYDRSLIVSALSLSIINFKFDSKKANLLLDFITDFETNVWERSLTGLTIAIIYQKNRSWLRDKNFLNRLKTLQHKEEIQEGLELINFILMNKLYEYNLFNPNLFKIELFQNPMNCFVPFYDNNEILKNAIDNAENDFDLDEFKQYLDNIPFMDSHKYALCLGLSSGNLAKSKLEGDKAKKLNYSLNISNSFKPYQNLISEYYCFFNYFPEKIKDDVFKKQLLLANTDLRKYILNKVTQLFLEANTLYNEEKYIEAINKYEDLLKIDKFHKEALWQLGNCYLSKNNIEKALKVFLDLEKESGGKPEKDLLYIIAKCYNVNKNPEKSNEYCNKIESEVKNPSFKLLFLKADNFHEIDDKLNSYSYCQKAEEKTTNEEDMYDIAQIYNFIGKNTDALRLTEKILETKPEVAKYWRELGDVYCNKFEWELSINALIKAKELDHKSVYNKMLLGRSYLLSKIDLEKAKQLLEDLLKSKNDFKGLTFGNLGHFYFIEGNNDKAFENYFKCIQDFNDDKDFNKRMDSDIKFIEKLQLNVEDYISLKNKVIHEFNLSKNVT
ncbi:tetratricopeptide repeat protein [Flavobacterium tistrianum]|uniref:tetratricopeptide repeat protein n=1 Tax=Flavobacterium tistrianum TaxID=1685414 RepID=UPI000DAC97FB|nr:tetratricopeptide repeat protein [Flavobacterium tistrianum]KAF2339464.1 tetratricopeptide repeat protein [Flavobacterium tistrianum]